MGDALALIELLDAFLHCGQEAQFLRHIGKRAIIRQIAEGMENKFLLAHRESLIQVACRINLFGLSLFTLVQRLQTGANGGDLDQFRETMAQAQTVNEPERRQ